MIRALENTWYQNMKEEKIAFTDCYFVAYVEISYIDTTLFLVTEDITTMVVEI